MINGHRIHRTATCASRDKRCRKSLGTHSEDTKVPLIQVVELSCRPEPMQDRVGYLNVWSAIDLTIDSTHPGRARCCCTHHKHRFRLPTRSRVVNRQSRKDRTAWIGFHLGVRGSVLGIDTFPIAAVNKNSLIMDCFEMVLGLFDVKVTLEVIRRIA